MKITDKQLTLSLPYSWVTALLAVLYMIAFLCTPYWAAHDSSTGRLMLLGVTIILGAAWCLISGGSQRINLSVNSLVLFLGLLACAIFLNTRTLNIDIPWRGDEDFHIRQLLNHIYNIRFSWIIFYCTAFLLFLVLAWKRPIYALPVVVIIVIVTVFGTFTNNPFQGRDVSLLRYPYFSYWITGLIPKIGLLVANPYHEVLYRVIPVLCAAAIAWYFQHAWPEKNIWWVKFLWGIAVLLIPIVYYYSSILYLELPVVFLMLVACTQMDRLLFDDPTLVKHHTGWIALILIGLIKETTVPFLAVYLMFRWLAQIWGHIQRPGVVHLLKWVIGELSITFSVLFPLFFYIYLRSTLTSTRQFLPDLSNLLKVEVYIAYGQSFVDQFGILLILFIIGWAMLIKKRQYFVAGFLITALVVTPLFHIIDNWIYAGYSRFNLFLLPIFLYGTQPLLSFMSKRYSPATVAIAIVVITVNLLASPINLDGSKRPFWDDYVTDVSEHYYPYREALGWISGQHKTESVLYIGQPYPYFLGFYFTKFNWQPKHRILNITDPEYKEGGFAAALKIAEEEGYRIVFFRSEKDEIPALPESAAFHQEKVFRNQAHSIVIYSMNSP